MPLSVRKSISLAPIAAALSLTIGLTLCSARVAAQGEQKQQLPQGAKQTPPQGAKQTSPQGAKQTLPQGTKQPLSQSTKEPQLPQSVQKQPAMQIKKLDDNDKEVLRPIPAVLKTKSESAAPAKPLEKQKAATVPDKSATVPNKGAAAQDKAVAVPDKSTAVPDKDTAAKPGSAKTTKAGISEKKSGARVKAVARGTHFVPPPPPSTPTLMGDSTDFGFYGGMPVEMLSKDALKDRAKEISIQYKDACRELEDHSRQKQEKIQRAADFEGLYKEGVVSRRELEASQKEAAEVNSDIDRLSFKVKELKGLQDRINRRLTSTVAKKSGHKLIN
jgi:hypothetical protein